MERKKVKIMNNQAIDQAINKLHVLVQKKTGVSKYIENYLVSLGQKHEVDLGSLCNLDKEHFKACATLFLAIHEESKFNIWEKLHMLGYKK